jgi:23S rRNA (guanosine2251-2'-O)-methyltransferase
MKIEGRNAVYELLNSNQKIGRILCQENSAIDNQKIVDLAKKKGVNIKFVPKQSLDTESVTKHHQGVIATIEDFNYSTLDNIILKAQQKNEPLFLVMVDEVSDPHNLGSIIRTCECAGVHGIVIQKNRSVQVNETVIKVSTGAAFKIDIARVTNINDAVRELKKNDVFVYALEADGDLIYDINLTTDLCLIVGSEGFGVGALTKKLSDKIVSLPMRGEINSLNASVATGVAVYEVLKQRIKR